MTNPYTFCSSARKYIVWAAKQRMPGRSEGKKRLCVGNQGRVEGGETMDGMYYIIEESIFNKKPTKTF